MHFHFIGSRETLFTLNCMSRYTLVPVCHRWLCLVGVILSVPEGRAEFTWRSSNHGCKLNTTMGWGRPRGTCLPVIFRHWVHLWVGVLSIFLCQEAGSAFAPCCHPVPYGEPSGKVANPSLAYVIHRAWFGCGFSLHSSVAVSTRQYGTCSCVGKGMYWEYWWENVKSRRYLASCLAEHHFPAWGEDHMASIHP